MFTFSDCWPSSKPRVKTQSSGSRSRSSHRERISDGKSSKQRRLRVMLVSPPCLLFMRTTLTWRNSWSLYFSWVSSFFRPFWTPPLPRSKRAALAKSWTRPFDRFRSVFSFNKVSVVICLLSAGLPKLTWRVWEPEGSSRVSPFLPVSSVLNVLTNLAATRRVPSGDKSRVGL